MHVYSCMYNNADPEVRHKARPINKGEKGTDVSTFEYIFNVFPSIRRKLCPKIKHF